MELSVVGVMITVGVVELLVKVGVLVVRSLVLEEVMGAREVTLVVEKLLVV